MKKLSEINERLFNGGVSRSHKNSARIEDRMDSNIKELKEVDIYPDFPFVFADKDLIINGKTKMTFPELMTYMSQIKSEGWRLPDYSELAGEFGDDEIFEFRMLANHSTAMRCKKYLTGPELVFPTRIVFGCSYHMTNDYYSNNNQFKNKYVEENYFRIHYSSGVKYHQVPMRDEDEFEAFQIRLVKDKRGRLSKPKN